MSRLESAGIPEVTYPGQQCNGSCTSSITKKVGHAPPRRSFLGARCYEICLAIVPRKLSVAHARIFLQYSTQDLGWGSSFRWLRSVRAWRAGKPAVATSVMAVGSIATQIMQACYEEMRTDMKGHMQATSHAKCKADSVHQLQQDDQQPVR